MAIPKLFSLSLLAASMLAISAPAMASQKTKEVRHADLDLATTKGQERLKMRIKQAVKQVCASSHPGTLKEWMEQNSCEKDAHTRAMPKADQAIATYLEKRRFVSRKDSGMIGN